MIAPATILVVDDSATMRAKAGLAARNLGHAVEEAGDGVAALERLAAGGIDLVILDIVMPRMDGYAVLEAMRADPILREVPVLVISSLEEAEDAARAIELGATDALSKAFHPLLFRARIAACLERRRLRLRELDVLVEATRLTEAAARVEAGAVAPEGLGLDPLLARGDALGDLARVFRHMAGEIHAREARLREQVRLLRGTLLLLAVALPYALAPTLLSMIAEAGHHPLGVTALTVLGIAAVGAVLCLLRRRAPTLAPRRIGFGMRVGLVGTILPTAALLMAAKHVDASVLTLLITTEMLFIFALAAVLGLERPDARRFLGVLLGAMAVVVVAAPEFEGGTGSAALPWMALGLAAGLLYAGESILLGADEGNPDDVVQTITVIMGCAALLCVPAAHFAGVLPPLDMLLGVEGPAVPLMVAISTGTSLGYAYVVREMGAVFASQYNGPLAISGILWAMLLLGERPGPELWIATALILGGLLLVRPADPPSAVPARKSPT